MQNYKKGWGNLPLEKKYINITQDKKLKLTVGNRRSYGDVCELAGGEVNSMLEQNRFISWDSEKLIVEVQAGMTIGDLCKWAITQNAFPSTVPGTQQPTIGGCIANDIHGKNHHLQGSFGNGVLAIKLLREGQVINCSRTENSELFFATVGGLGLTGEIVSATLQLIPFSSAFLSVVQRKFKSLDEYFEIDQTLGANSEYTVAWLDCAHSPNGDSKAGFRGVYMAGDSVKVTKEYLVKHQKIINKNNLIFPISPPFSFVGKFTLSVFNQLYYHLPRPIEAKLTHYQNFFFPLDKIHLWNRVYGKNGFYQYQCVIPKNVAYETLIEMLNLIVSSGMGSPLLVLKNLGDKSSGGLLSFAREGVTLALDFVNHGEKTLKLLEKLDQITLSVGGCGNPSKDARMSTQTFQKYFPQYLELEKFREQGRCSDFWLRVTSGLSF